LDEKPLVSTYSFTYRRLCLRSTTSEIFHKSFTTSTDFILITVLRNTRAYKTLIFYQRDTRIVFPLIFRWNTGRIFKTDPDVCPTRPTDISIQHIVSSWKLIEWLWRLHKRTKIWISHGRNIQKSIEVSTRRLILNGPFTSFTLVWMDRRRWFSTSPLVEYFEKRCLRLRKRYVVLIFLSTGGGMERADRGLNTPDMWRAH